MLLIAFLRCSEDTSLAFKPLKPTFLTYKERIDFEKEEELLSHIPE